jgi:hypothetical protein
MEVPPNLLTTIGIVHLHDEVSKTKNKTWGIQKGRVIE